LLRAQSSFIMTTSFCKSVAMTTAAGRETPVLLWPFVMLWAFVGFVLRAVGRIVCAVLGLALMAAGVALTLTVLGAIVGVPLAAFGLLLLVRALF
jgi:hypothetical protein